MMMLTERGLFCEAGGFYVDPRRAVDHALITHAHSDHARKGSANYICAEPGVELLRRRLGSRAKIQGVPYGKVIRFGRTEVSFHSAGHVLGSAQIRVAQGGQVWVVSGDFKREPDPTCAPFDVVPCDVFITEATFAHPAYCWGDSREAIREIHDWWKENRERGKNSVLLSYSLGKAQRVLGGLLSLTDEPAYVFGEAGELADCYRAQGVGLLPTKNLEAVAVGTKLKGELVIASHSILKSDCMKLLGNPEIAFASGWMKTGAFGMRRAYDRGFVLSDHADWPALLRTIEETQASRVFVHEGNGKQLIAELKRRGIQAAALVEGQRPPEVVPVQGELFKLQPRQ